MALYFHSAASIYPDTFSDSTNKHKYAKEPGYDEFIEPMVARRMSRILKMGQWCGQTALQKSDTPNAIIVGTAYGCLEDTGSFLQKMIAQQENNLNPTPFIHSTHNTISAQLAIKLKCFAYNQTYTQHSFSFDHVLIDANMQAEADEDKILLLGAIDELTEISQQELTKIYTRIFDNEQLTLGESSSFFTAGARKKPQSLGKLLFHECKFKYDADQLIQSIGKRIKLFQNDTLFMVASDNDKGLVSHISDNNKITISKIDLQLGLHPVINACALSLFLNGQAISDIDTSKFSHAVIINDQLGKYFSWIEVERC